MGRPEVVVNSRSETKIASGRHQSETSAHDHSNPTIIIVLSGSVENQGGGGTEPATFQGGGTIIYSAGMHTLTRKGDTPAHLVEVEIR